MVLSFLRNRCTTNFCDCDDDDSDFTVLVMTDCMNVDAVQSDEDVSSASSAFLYIWVVSAFASTCYTFIWDVRMDWGLFDKNAGDNRYLREEIVYFRKVDNCCTCRICCYSFLLFGFQH